MTSHATAIVSLLACLQKLFTATLNGRSYSGRQNGVFVLQPFVLSLFQSVIFNSVFDTLMLSVETKAFFLTPELGPSSVSQENVKWDQRRHRRTSQVD